MSTSDRGDEAPAGPFWAGLLAGALLGAALVGTLLRRLTGRRRP